VHVEYSQQSKGVAHMKQYKLSLSFGSLIIIVTLLLSACGGGGASSTPQANNVPRFAYVANSGDNTISIYTVNATNGKLRHNGYAMTGAGPQSVTVDPSGKFAYVANYGSTTVSCYTINAATGALTSAGTVTAGTSPYSVTMDPAGKFAYVANFGSASVSAYTIDGATGVLTQIDADSGTAGTQNFPTGAQPLSVTVAASGKFAFVVTNGGEISAFTIDPATGALTSAGTVATGFAMRSVAVDPTGKFVYVAATLNFGRVLAYSVNATTGALSPVAGSPFSSTGDFPIAVTVDPSGKFVYVANYSTANVSQYSIDPGTGALTSMGTIAAGINPSSVTVDPSGKFLYVTNQGSHTVSIFPITPAGLNTPSTVAARKGCAAMAMTRGTAAVTYTPKFAYAANYGPGSIVSAYTINAATGALTALADTSTLSLGTSVTVDPSGRFAYTTHEVLFETPTVNVSTYTIDSTSGVLTRVGAAAAVASFPASITVEPSGRFAYIANSASDSVSVHTIDAATGALTYMGFLITESGPVSIAVDPSGRFAYVVNYDSASISGYLVNASSGALATIDLNGALVGTAMGAGSSPTSVTVDPSGKFVYVTQINGVNAYVIDAATGVLINASFAAAGTDPRSVIVEPSGRFAYVANGGGNVSAFSINATTGALTSFGTVTAGDQPRSITVDPSGKFAYVANLGSNDVSVYAINAASGALTGIGTMPAGTGPVSITTTGTIQ
jgi:6-phosphogluconolactonase (cycloisomerase 2 family)